MATTIETAYQGNIVVKWGTGKYYITIISQGHEISLELSEARSLAFLLIGMTEPE